MTWRLKRPRAGLYLQEQTALICQADQPAVKMPISELKPGWRYRLSVPNAWLRYHTQLLDKQLSSRDIKQFLNTQSRALFQSPTSELYIRWLCTEVDATRKRYWFFALEKRRLPQHIHIVAAEPALFSLLRFVKSRQHHSNNMLWVINEANAVSIIFDDSQFYGWYFESNPTHNADVFSALLYRALLTLIPQCDQRAIHQLAWINLSHSTWSPDEALLRNMGFTGCRSLFLQEQPSVYCRGVLLEEGMDV